jgi:hypothetical protein
MAFAWTRENLIAAAASDIPQNRSRRAAVRGGLRSRSQRTSGETASSEEKSLPGFAPGARICDIVLVNVDKIRSRLSGLNDKQAARA